jgi:hypothetical protein
MTLTLGEMPDGIVYLEPGSEKKFYKYPNFMVVANSASDADALLKDYIANILGVIKFIEIDIKGELPGYIMDGKKEIEAWNQFVARIEMNITLGPTEVE